MKRGFNLCGNMEDSFESDGEAVDYAGPEPINLTDEDDADVLVTGTTERNMDAGAESMDGGVDLSKFRDLVASNEVKKRNQNLMESPENETSNAMKDNANSNDVYVEGSEQEFDHVGEISGQSGKDYPSNVYPNPFHLVGLTPAPPSLDAVPHIVSIANSETLGLRVAGTSEVVDIGMTRSEFGASPERLSDVLWERIREIMYSGSFAADLLKCRMKTLELFLVNVRSELKSYKPELLKKTLVDILSGVVTCCEAVRLMVMLSTASPSAELCMGMLIAALELKTTPRRPETEPCPSNCWWTLASAAMVDWSRVEELSTDHNESAMTSFCMRLFELTEEQIKALSVTRDLPKKKQTGSPGNESDSTTSSRRSTLADLLIGDLPAETLSTPGLKAFVKSRITSEFVLSLTGVKTGCKSMMDAAVKEFLEKNNTMGISSNEPEALVDMSIRNLAKITKAKQIMEQLVQFAPVFSGTIFQRKGGERYATVKFRTTDDCNACVEKFSNVELDGNVLVALARKRKRSSLTTTKNETDGGSDRKRQNGDGKSDGRRVVPNKKASDPSGNEDEMNGEQPAESFHSRPLCIRSPARSPTRTARPSSSTDSPRRVAGTAYPVPTTQRDIEQERQRPEFEEHRRVIEQKCSEHDRMRHEEDLMKRKAEVEVLRLERERACLKLDRKRLEVERLELELQKNRDRELLERDRKRREDEERRQRLERERLEGEHLQIERQKNQLERDRKRREDEERRQRLERERLEGEHLQIERQKNQLERDRRRLEDEERRQRQEREREREHGTLQRGENRSTRDFDRDSDRMTGRRRSPESSSRSSRLDCAASPRHRGSPDRDRSPSRSRDQRFVDSPRGFPQLGHRHYPDRTRYSASSRDAHRRFEDFPADSGSVADFGTQRPESGRSDHHWDGNSGSYLSSTTAAAIRDTSLTPLAGGSVGNSSTSAVPYGSSGLGGSHQYDNRYSGSVYPQSSTGGIRGGGARY